jgi:hypothetical protein
MSRASLKDEEQIREAIRRAEFVKKGASTVSTRLNLE